MAKLQDASVASEQRTHTKPTAIAAALKETAELRVKLRPRERAPLTLAVRVRGDGQSLRWVFREPLTLPPQA
jgi:hypothetical protein